jgi:hypothetical protein
MKEDDNNAVEEAIMLNFSLSPSLLNISPPLIYSSDWRHEAGIRDITAKVVPW